MKKLISIFTVVRHIQYLALAKEVIFFGRFFVLVIIFLFFESIGWVGKLRPIRFLTRGLHPASSRLGQRFLEIFNGKTEGEISSLDLIKLALRHLKAKKVRTMITIGGMAIGFGSIIFLLSLGYGTQKLVISKVAKLNEMKQIDVTVGQASSLAINDQLLSEFRKIEKVTTVLPIVSIVAKVDYNNSVSSVITYGVTAEYLEQSAIKPIAGKIFEDQTDQVSARPADQTLEGQVAGVSLERQPGAKIGKEVSQINYSIYPQEWKPVYQEPSEKAQLLGYTRRNYGEQNAYEVWGEFYRYSQPLLEGIDAIGNVYRPWIRDTFPIWEKQPCSVEKLDCEDSNYTVIREGGQQQLVQGYITEAATVINRYRLIFSAEPNYQEGTVLDHIQFTSPAGRWLTVHSEASAESELFNNVTTTKDPDSLQEGQLILGESYFNGAGWGSVARNNKGQPLGLWVRTTQPIWKKLECSTCENMYLEDLNEQQKQIAKQVLIRADQVKIENMAEPPHYGSVLGIATSSAMLDLASGSAVLSAATSSSQLALAEVLPVIEGMNITSKVLSDGSVEWTSVASGSAADAFGKREVVPFAKGAQKVALVNVAMLKLLNIDQNQALNQKFKVTLMLDNDFFSKDDFQAESDPTDLTIIGVLPDEKSPAYYLPFADIKGLGVDNYSQAKVVVENQKDVKAVRQNIEAMGYRTASVVDTVNRINSLFDTVRLLLSVLGFVALGVAALGMFNTLTVSLLEKTREVGLMKAIGMKSNEVKRLFLAESIIMGLSGGIFGLAVGVSAGYSLSIALSTISITKGFGYINLVNVPVFLVFGIVSLSFLIGVLTGMYPSVRATKISALNALRYE